MLLRYDRQAGPRVMKSLVCQARQMDCRWADHRDETWWTRTAEETSSRGWHCRHTDTVAPTLMPIGREKPGALVPPGLWEVEDAGEEVGSGSDKLKVKTEESDILG